MRSTQKEQGIISFSGYCNGTASGIGVAQPGNIPFLWTKTATGQWTITFDSRIVAFSAVGMATLGAIPIVISVAWGFGFVRFTTASSANVAADGQFLFTIAARDTRG